MSLQHFYLEEQVLAHEQESVFSLRLQPDDLKHLKVLRVHPGEHIAVVDAAQDYFECCVEAFDGSSLQVSISQHREAARKGPRVMLLQGLAKGDKMETVIRHATELGVSEFVPVACSRSVLKLDAKKEPKKIERWRAIAKSAAMQSGQPAVPRVQGVASVSEAAQLAADALAVCVCWEEAPQSTTMRQAVQNGLAQAGEAAADGFVAVVVGPEGGLSENEVQAFLSANPAARLVSLGPSILRTETAGIVAPALALYELGGLGGAQ